MRPQARKNRRRTLWGTLRIFRAENEVGCLFQQPTYSSRIAPCRTVICVTGSPEDFSSVRI